MNEKCRDALKGDNEYMTESDNLVTCPTWHRPLLRVVKDGIEVKCKYCKGLLHSISREEIERVWLEQEQGISEQALITIK